MSSRDCDADDESLRPDRSRRDDPGDFRDTPHRGGLILALGISSLVLAFLVISIPIGLILGIMALNWGYDDLARIDDREMDPKGRWSTDRGMVYGFVGSALGATICAGCFAFGIVKADKLALLFAN